MAAKTNYEQLAAEYARHRRVHPGVLQQLIERAEITSQSRVLEVGCGTGNYIVALEEATGCIAMGIDPSDAMLAHAKTRSITVDWRSGQAESLPVDDSSIDLIFSVDVIHHVSDRAAFFTDAMRALAPGGKISTATDSKSDIMRRRPLSSHFPETVAHELRRYPNIETLRSEMAIAGFIGIDEAHVELEYDLSELQPYRDRAFSSLHLIAEPEFHRGIDRLELDLTIGPVSALSLYTLVWGIGH